VSHSRSSKLEGGRVGRCTVVVDRVPVERGGGRLEEAVGDVEVRVERLRRLHLHNAIKTTCVRDGKNWLTRRGAV